MLTLALSLLILGRAPAPPSTANLVAGTVTANGTSLVRLRWTMGDGWIPDGGFNLYRATGAGAPILLNSAPLKVDPAGLTHPMIQAAMQPVAVDGQQLYLNSKTPPRVSSAPTFASLRAAAGAALLSQTGEKGLRTAMSATPEFKAFSAKLPKARPKVTTLTPVQQVGFARSTIILGSMITPGFAEKVGMGFDDAKVQPGATYTYTLKAINAKVESSVLATLTLTVGKDAMPPAPLVEVPIQTSAHSMNLHFEIPTNVSESAFGALWFVVTRVDGANANGVSLSATPIMPTYVATSDGNDTPALTSFIDTKAAYGPVKYTVQVEDAFRRLGPPVTVQATFADIAAPAPVLGAVADVPGRRGSGTPSPTITFIASAGDSSVKLPNAEPVQYRLERQSNPDKPVLKNNAAAWTPVGSGPADGTPVDAAALTIHDLGRLSPKFRSLVIATCVPKGLSKAQAQSAFAKVEQSKASVTLAKYPALATVAKAFVLRQVVDPSPVLDTYCIYRVTPVMKRNSVLGDPGLSSVVGVPAAQAPTAPGTITFTDVAAPNDVSTIKGSITNGVRMQPTSGTFPPNAARPAGDPRALGQQYLAAYRTKRKMAATKMSLYTTVVAANYGRMVTLSWSSPAYSSPVRYRVYRGSGTGFTVGTPGTGALKQAAFNGVNLLGHGLVSSFPKSRYSLNTAPGPKDYVLLGTTKPGETSFVDIIQRSFSAYYYYYVMPVSRWGVDGKPSSPVPVQVKESLPPTPPVVESVRPTSTTAITATVQPNLQVENVVQYQLLRTPITTTATVTTVEPTGATGTATVRNGKVLTGALTKQGTASAINVTLGGIQLANGAAGNGAAKYGIVSQTAPGVAIAAFRNTYRAALVAKKPPPALPADLAPLFKIATYAVVATVKVDPASTTPVVLNDTTAVPGEEYLYCVVAVSGSGLNSDPGGFVDATLARPAADAPTVSGATFNVAVQTVTFNITPPASGAAAFYIERESEANDATSWIHIGTVTAPASGAVLFTDGNVRRGGNTYIYRVCSIDSKGRSSVTSDASGTLIGYATVTVTSS